MIEWLFGALTGGWLVWLWCDTRDDRRLEREEQQRREQRLRSLEESYYRGVIRDWRDIDDPHPDN